MSFRIIRTHTAAYLISDRLTAPHAFATRLGGVSPLPHTATLNLAFGRGDERDTVLENLSRFGTAAGFDPHSVISVPQVHGNAVHTVDRRHRGMGYHLSAAFEGDGYVTADSAVTLGVKTADCTPILLEAVAGGTPAGETPACGTPVAVAALHAGWKGTVLNIVGEGVRRLRELACAQAGVPAESVTIRAAIGPCIHACCFEVKEDCLAVVRERVGDAMAAGFIHGRGGKTYLDLPGLNRALLLRAGVAEADIDVCELCTACHPELFYSHRASGGLRGTMLNAIWLAGDEL
jgi:YfiH family protein